EQFLDQLLRARALGVLQRLRGELAALRGAAPIPIQRRLTGVDAGETEIVADPLEDCSQFFDDRRQVVERALAPRDRGPELGASGKAPRAPVAGPGGLVDPLARLGHPSAFECARGEIDEERGTLLVAVRKQVGAPLEEVRRRVVVGATESREAGPAQAFARAARRRKLVAAELAPIQDGLFEVIADDLVLFDERDVLLEP